LKLVSYIVGFLSWFAGIMFLLENTGDPWLEFSPENRQEQGAFTYLDAIWFLMITSSTVGYGDISPATVLGKVAVMLFVCGKLSVVISLMLTI
jgi:voltage-gated potassium channel Kch